MNQKFVLGLLLIASVTTSAALADTLSDNTEKAKKTWDIAKVDLERAATSQKLAEEALAALVKPNKDWLPIQELKLDTALASWCDMSCVESYKGFRQTDGAIDLSKLPVPTVPSDQVSLAGLNTETKKAILDDSKSTDIPGFVARVAKATVLTPTQKALLVVACYRAPDVVVTVGDCAKNVDTLTNGGNANARTQANMREIAALGKLPDIVVDANGYCWREPQCHETYQSLISPEDKKLELTKLPSIEMCEAAKKAIEQGSPKSADELVSKVKFGGDAIEVQKAFVLAVCPASLSPDYGAKCIERIEAVLNYQRKIEPLKTALASADAELKNRKENESSLQKRYLEALQAQLNASDVPASRIADRLASVRRARCATAYCWGGNDGRKYAVEPIVDVPIGMYWSAGGGALAQYVNANNIKIYATAGLRYWFAYDVMSVGILLAQPELTDAQTTVDFRDKALASSQVRRPYPTLVFGVWGDIIQLSVSYDELRNASRSNANYIQDYPGNAVLSRAVTFGVALNPVTSARNGIGASVSSTEAAK